MRWSGGMLVLAAVCMLGSGCVSTPASRIKANPSLFASFPPQVQEQVRKGAVAVGFTEDMVRMALGDPDRVILRTTAALQTKIWVYTDVRYSSRMEPIEAGYCHAVALIMSNASLRTGMRATFDKAARQVMAGGKVFKGY